MSSNLEENENVITIPLWEKLKKPNRNVGNQSKIEVLNKETVVLHEEAVRSQPRSPQRGNQYLHK